MFTGIFFFFLCLSYALLENEIEGKYGWAWKLPTWYKVRGPIATPFSKYFLGGRPCNGYNMTMLFFTTMFFHFPFMVGLEWSIVKELEIIALIFLFWPVNEFLRIVMCPDLTIVKFKRDQLPWRKHMKWVSKDRIPFDHLQAIAIFFVLSFLAILFSAGENALKLLTSISLFYLTVFACTAIAVIFSPIYHKWYRKMREDDHRSECGFTIAED